ncbi:hypothetical protein LWI28_014484 [Acer negundo]|uniref:RNase H type-1 domain-containing protein n=1 Tax=Acer negundo TaxID=4023 RepID=A0AAD5NWT7_ACENE|nr:hypothetical protein LWI28_014484 [Acer negundo]
MTEGLPHYLQFSCVVWFLWKWRCNKVFDHNYSVPQSLAVVINMLAKEWLKANFSTNERDEILMSIRWMKPNVDWVKLNVDGSRNSISGMITAVLVESDSLNVVKMMNEETKRNHPCFSIIQSCKNLMRLDWDRSIDHVYREGSKLVDGLANMGQSMDTGIVFFDNTPCEMVLIFESDFNDLSCFRHASVRD